MLLNSVQYYRPVEDIASSCAAGEAFTRGTQRDYSPKPLKHSIVKRILVFKR